MDLIVQHYDHFYPEVGCFSLEEEKPERSKGMTAAYYEEQITRFYMLSLEQELDRNPFRIYFTYGRPMHIDTYQYFY
jgi:hypothetical protein